MAVPEVTDQDRQDDPESQAAAVLADMDEVMAQEDFDDDPRYLAGSCCQKMVFLAEMADSSDSRKRYVGDIWDGPGCGQRPEAAVPVELVPKVMAGNDVDGLAAQDGPQDNEAQFRPQDFADPGNEIRPGTSPKMAPLTVRKGIDGKPVISVTVIMKILMRAA